MKKKKIIILFYGRCLEVFIDHLVDKGPNNETFPIFKLSLDTVDSFKKSKSLILYSEDFEKFKNYNSLQLFKLSTTKYIFYTEKNINGQDEKEILFGHSRKIISILRYLNQDLKRFFGKYSEKYKEKYEKYIQICSSVSTFFADINQIEI